jgi:hypothetical protein
MPGTKLALGLSSLALTAGATAVITAVTPTAAHAGMTVNFPTPPDGWGGICYAAKGVDRVLGATADAMLVFEGDGNLAMYATNSAGTPLWETATGGSYRELCIGDGGSLSVNNYQTGAVLWSRSASGATLTIDDDCDLVATTSSGSVSYTVAGTCPGETAAALFTGWCADTTEEAVLVESDWAQLKWLTTGKLAIVATGSRDGSTLWSTSTAGAKICFEDGGRLAIYASQTATSPSWTSNSVGDTSTQYLLGLDDCALTIDNFSTGATAYTTGTGCSHGYASRPSTFRIGSWNSTTGSYDDKVVLENDDAELVLDGASALELRSKDGDVFWRTNTSSIARLEFQASDGNLVLYNASGSAQWSTGVNSAASKLVLDGCQVSIVDSSGSKLWSKGPQDCSKSSVALDSTTYQVNKSNTYLLRGQDSYLAWTSSGNLCLYTTSGTQLWCALSSSTSTSNYLTMSNDGSIGTIAIYNSSGTQLWSQVGFKLTTSSSFPFTTYVPATKLTLADGCKLQLKTSSGSATNTLNSECTVAKYTYESTEGSSMFGVTLGNSMTGTAGSSNKLNSVTGIDVNILGNTGTLFEATGYQTTNSDGSVTTAGDVEVLDEIQNELSFSISVDIFDQSKTFMVGVVPVTVSASVSGSLGLGFEISSGQLAITPAAGLSATVSAAVGAESEVAGASAGIKGDLTLLEISLPITLKVYKSDSAWKFSCTGALTIETLSGTLSLFAEAYVKFFGAKLGVEYSKKIFSWTGLSWTKTLFSTTSGAF